jgi:MFS superfamily sulfate permease-like transporter
LTLLAIAIPEQIATAQLAEVPAFQALLAFFIATLVFALLGSNPVMSIGVDSSIAPLFASPIVVLAAFGTARYSALVSAVAVVTGLVLVAVGTARLGWVADFLSAPIVAGFMTGIGVTIIAHQLPHALGLPSEHGSVARQLASVIAHIGDANVWCLVLAGATLAAIVVGERISPRFPTALIAIVAATLVTRAGDLVAHGVKTIGHLSVIGPSWRLSSLHWSDVGVIVTTALTVSIVVVSQSAATSRDAADDLGVDVVIDRDFFAVGVANALAGLLGAIPVNASPARTDIVRLAKGRSQLVGVVAGVGVLATIPLLGAMASIPVAALSGILFYIAWRLIRVAALRQIAKINRYEFALALVTTLGVVLIGVEVGVGIAVVLAVFDHTRRSVRPTSIVLGRRPDSTSWEPLGDDGARPAKHVAVVMFSAPLYFANASLFRSEIHAALHAQPEARHLVIDAAAITDIDFTGLQALSKLVLDVEREGMDIAVARANDSVLATLAAAPVPQVAAIRTYGTVEEAVRSMKE